MQSLNDFLVFGVMIVGSFSSGVLLNAFGWNEVLWGSPVPVGLALFTLLLRPYRHPALSASLPLRGPSLRFSQMRCRTLSKPARGKTSHTRHAVVMSTA